jgi:predicted flap endonuclease-1-like 5' DNA nuclease
MMYLLSNYAGWLIAALLVGALVSLFTCRGRGPCPGWIVALVVFVVGLIVALLKLLPGRAGLLLDTALLFSAAYMIGCLIGCWLGGLMRDASTTNKSAAPEIRTLKPAALAAPNGGVADDLRLIQGVGPNEEKKLNDNGIFHYAQVAGWNAENVAWASSLFGAPGRVEAEQWTPQARVLAAGRDTDYSVLLRAARRRVEQASGLSGSGVAAAAQSVAQAGSPAPDGLPLAPTGGLVARDETPVAPQIVETAPKPAEPAAPVAVTAVAPSIAPAPVARPQGGLPLAPGGDTKPVSAPASAMSAVAASATRPSGLPLAPTGGQVAHDATAVAPQIVETAPKPAAPAAAPVAVTAAAPSIAPAPVVRPQGGLPLAPGGDTKPVSAPASATSAVAASATEPSGLPLAPTGGPVAHLTAAVTPLVVARAGGAASAPAATAAPMAASAPVATAAASATTLAARPAGALPLAPSGAVWAKASGGPAIEDGPPAPHIEGEEKYAGSRPPGLLGPRGGKADDLKHVKGIGPQNEGRLHGLGIWHFDQIAAWTRDQVLWVGSYLAFPGRIDRENWVEQARLLAQGIQTEFARRAAAGLVPTSKDDGSLGQSNVAHVEKKND